MPNSFPDGTSALVDLFGGDPTKQIQSMWSYLSMGDSAKEPEGLKPGAILLAADKRPRIYRNFFTDVSARGIGVSYPAKANLIWDAEEMSLARLWKNSFVDASMHWNGRGQGRQSPLGDDVIALDKQTPLALLGSIDAPWPTKSAREQGYKFRGYQLDKDGQPTFRYQIGSVNISDKPTFTNADGKRSLERRFEITLDSSSPEGLLVWRLASGNIKAIGDGKYRIDDAYDLSVDSVTCQVIRIGQQDELRAKLPASNLESMTLIQTITW